MNVIYIVLIIIGVILGVAIYLLPTLFAFSRKHDYKWIILIINVLFGATILAWVIVLIWAVWPTKKTLIDPVINPTGGYDDAYLGKRAGTYKKYSNQIHSLQELYALKNKGAITEQEYNELKKDLI